MGSWNTRKYNIVLAARVVLLETFRDSLMLNSDLLVKTKLVNCLTGRRLSQIDMFLRVVM